ncbi:MAG: DUF2497 domain-containing protein [Pseudomonadota bacterium]
MENAQPEPSMEEILASIRRIISEDEDDAAPAPASPKPERAAAPESAPAPAPKPVESQTREPAPTPIKTPEPEVRRSPAPTPIETEDVEMIRRNVAEAMEQDADDAILDETSAAAASQAFENLSQSVRVSGDGKGQTLEDIVVQMLKPMIKDWLNQNLPAIVEEKVEEEVQRVARRRR